MGGYIRLDKAQAEDPRLYNSAHKLAEIWEKLPPGLGVMRHALLGVTVTLWSYADTHILSDDSLRVTLDGLASLLDVPVALLQALPPDWLRVRADEMVELPGYCAKNRVRGKDLRKADWADPQRRKRELDAARAKRYRDRKRREKRNGRHAKNVTLPSRSRHATGTGPDPLPHTGTVPGSAAARAGAEGPAPPRGEETPAVKAARAKLRGLVAGLGAKAKPPT